MFVGYGFEIAEVIYVGVGGVDDVGIEELIEAFPPGVGTAKHPTAHNNNTVVTIFDNFIIFVILLTTLSLKLIAYSLYSLGAVAILIFN